jgi:hypothetical protein
MTRILVCGGRTFGELPKSYNNYVRRNGLVTPYPYIVIEDLARERVAEFRFIHKTLYAICFELTGTPNNDCWFPSCAIIHGGASGADKAADEWAIINLTGLEVFPADWEKHGKSAGSIRNQKMLHEGKPDIVVAFPGGAETADMVRKAKRTGVPVREIKYDSGATGLPNQP